MHIMDFLLSLLEIYWSDLLVIALFAVFIYLLGKYYSKPLAMKILAELVWRAEKELGSKTGDLKLNYVWNRFPRILKLFIPYNDFKNLVDLALETLYNELKKQSGDLLSYEAEQLKKLT